MTAPSLKELAGFAIEESQAASTQSLGKIDSDFVIQYLAYALASMTGAASSGFVRAGIQADEHADRGQRDPRKNEDLA